jgi:glycosyltransferase involved in cell wall biosynthesis
MTSSPPTEQEISTQADAPIEPQANPPTVSCIIPTMNRPALLEQTLTRLFETTKGMDVEAVVVIDESVESVEVCEKFIVAGHNVVYSFSAERRGAIFCWNLGLKMARANIYFHQGDDLDYENGWLDKALEAHRTKLNGYGMVGVNDSMHDGNRIATHVLFDRKFCIDFLGGLMAPTIISYYGVDNMLNELAKKAGKFFYCPEAVVNHIHPAAGKRPADATDASHQDFWTQDITTLDEWRNRGRNIEWEAVIS